jgi:hypothetical protein
MDSRIEGALLDVAQQQKGYSDKYALVVTE